MPRWCQLMLVLLLCLGLRVAAQPRDPPAEARAKLTDALEARAHEIGPSNTTTDLKFLLLHDIVTGFLTVSGAGDDWGDLIGFANGWSSALWPATTVLVTRREAHYEEAQSLSATAERLERRARDFAPEYYYLERAARLKQELAQLPTWTKAFDDERQRADWDARAMAVRVRQHLSLPSPAHLGSAPSALQTMLEAAAGSDNPYKYRTGPQAREAVPTSVRPVLAPLPEPPRYRHTRGSTTAEGTLDQVISTLLQRVSRYVAVRAETAQAISDVYAARERLDAAMSPYAARVHLEDEAMALLQPVEERIRPLWQQTASARTALLYSLTRRALWDFYERGLRPGGQGAPDPEASSRFRGLWEQDIKKFSTNELTMLTTTADVLASGAPAEIDRLRRHFEPHVCGLAIITQSRAYALPSFPMRILSQTTCGPKR